MESQWKVSAPRISVTLYQARWGLEGSRVHSRKQLKVLSTMEEGLGVMEKEDLLEATTRSHTSGSICIALLNLHTRPYIATLLI